jgi:hypothetical protein
MGETRDDQATFEWAGDGSGGAPRAEAATAAEPVATKTPRRAAKAPGAPAAGPVGRARSSVARALPAQRDEAAGPSAQPAALPPDTELWDVHAAARFLKRSVSWVYHRAEDGSLPVKRLSGWGLRFIPGELRAWVESGGVAPVRHRE